MRVVISDSEPDLNDDSDDSTGGTNAFQQSPRLSSTTQPSNGDSSGKSHGDTPSPVFGNRDPNHRNPTIRSDNHALSPVERSNIVKRKAEKWGIDPRNIISQSPRDSNESLSSPNDGERPEKRQRLTRGRGRNTVSYDMKHHPMDDILRPKYSAKRRANGNQIPKDSSESDEEMDEDDKNDASSENVAPADPHRRRSSRNIHKSKTPIYSAKWHPLDQMLRDNASSKSIPNKDSHRKKGRKASDSSSTPESEEGPMAVNSDLDPDQDAADKASELGAWSAPISPDRRRSIRIFSKDAPPNYDMKYGDSVHKKIHIEANNFYRYHVMDSTLRPKAAAKRMKSKLHSASTPHTSNKTSSKSASSAKTPTKMVQVSSDSSPRRSVHPESDSNCSEVPVAPAWSQLQDSYLNRSSLDWAELQQMDRCVCLLQKGAPFHSNSLPRDRNLDVAKKVLFDEGVITLDELNSQEATELLRNRYESVRQGLQNFFNSKPEPIDKNDWILSKSEGFDVYDMKRGSKYWKHRKDGVVEGTKTSSSSNILGFSAETAKQITRNNDQEATDNVSDEQDRDEAKAPASKQPNEGSNPNKSSFKGPRALEVDPERTRFVGHDENGELDVTIETEDTLVESMGREHRVPSSIMSDAALEELLSPIEHNSREEPGREVTAEMALSDLTSSESARLVPAHPDKILDNPSFIASEATATDLRALIGAAPLGNDTVAPCIEVDHGDGPGEPQTLKAEIKTRKRKSRVEVAIAVHEDPPGRTPLVKKMVNMNPVSPGTDIPKENLEDDGSVEHSSHAEITPRTRRHHEAIGTPGTRRVRASRNATTSTPPHRSLFGGPVGSSSSDSSPTTRYMM